MYEYKKKKDWRQYHAKIYYNSLPREERKLPIFTFLARVNKWLDYKEAMELPYRYKFSKPSRIKHPERTQYWEVYEWEKCPYNRFYSRMMQWTMSLEQAINPEVRKWGYVKWDKKTNTGWGWWIQTKHYETLVVNPDYYKIEITYTEEEWKIFKKVYQDMINKLQYEYDNEEDTHKGTEILNKLNSIKEEYKTFLNYNK